MKARDAVMASRDMCAVTCGKCGESAPLEEFTAAPVYGPLPPATFQCPKCREAFVRKMVPDKYHGTALKLVATGAVL